MLTNESIVKIQLVEADSMFYNLKMNSAREYVESKQEKKKKSNTFQREEEMETTKDFP